MTQEIAAESTVVLPVDIAIEDVIDGVLKSCQEAQPESHVVLAVHVAIPVTVSK